MSRASKHCLWVLAGQLLAGAASGQSFQTPQFSVGAEPFEIASADFDSNGRPDVVTSNFASQNITVLLADGNGSFFAGTSYAVGGKNPAHLSIGDTNGDGAADIAVMYLSSSPASLKTVSLFRGDGAGNFAAAAEIPITQGSAPVAVAIADLNGDGRGDLLCGSLFQSAASIVLADASGGFGGPVSFPLEAKAQRFAFADLDLDGILDAVASLSNQRVAVLRGDGLGSFASSTSYLSFVAGTAVRIADMNGDGLDDVIANNSSDDRIAVLAGDGLGGLGAPSVSPSGYHPTSLLVDDLDGDGWNDVLEGSEGWWVFRLQGNGPAGLGPPQEIYIGSRPRGLVMADFTIDGVKDLVCCMKGSNNVSLCAGDGSGGFSTVALAATGYPTQSVALGDLNGDGAADVVTANYLVDISSGAWLSVVLGDGSGGFGAVSHPPFPGGFPQSVVLRDMNADGRLDLVVTQIGSFFIQVLIGDGIGGFSTTLSSPAGGSTFGLAIDDLNFDGHPDAVTTLVNDAKGAVLLNLGGGALGVPAFVSAGPQPQAAALLDLNDDQKLDLLIANFGHTTVTRYLGNGFGAFTSPLTITTGESPDAMAFSDWNGDGKVDMATSNYQSMSISLLMGDGTGGFGPKSDLPLSFAPTHVSAADFDGDGRDDLAALSYSPAGTVRIFRGLGAAAFAEPKQFASGIGSFCAIVDHVSDLEGNGSADLITTDFSGNGVAILRNFVAPVIGISAFGVGTPGCAGRLGMRAKSPPKVNSPAFSLAVTNAPRDTIGLLLVGSASDSAGSDPFGIGVKLHVDMAASSFILAFDVFSDLAGSGIAPLPIPGDPSLVGLTAYLQSLWIENPVSGLACSSSPYHLVTSRGVTLVVQP